MSSNSTIQLNEKIKRFEQHLIQQQRQELQIIASAVQHCQGCYDNQSWYLCLSQQNLTYRQIAILEGISTRQHLDCETARWAGSQGAVGGTCVRPL